MYIVEIVKRFFLRLTCLSLAVITPGCTSTLQDTEALAVKNYEGFSFSFSLPVNATLPKGERIHLHVNIPKEYKCLQNNLSNLATNNLEFIPQNDVDPYKWSEIITVTSVVRMNLKNVHAHQLLEKFQQTFQQAGGLHKICNSIAHDYKTHRIASCVISYTDKGRKELLYIKYVYGPYDLASVQYAIALTDEITEEAALEKIKKFEQEQIYIVDVV